MSSIHLRRDWPCRKLRVWQFLRISARRVEVAGNAYGVEKIYNTGAVSHQLHRSTRPMLELAATPSWKCRHSVAFRVSITAAASTVEFLRAVGLDSWVSLRPLFPPPPLSLHRPLQFLRPCNKANGTWSSVRVLEMRVVPPGTRKLPRYAAVVMATVLRSGSKAFPEPWSFVSRT